MSLFKIIPASKQSLAQRKLVYGKGINDAKYMVIPTINGKRITCKFYQSWRSMLERCYSDKYHEKFPTYIGCTVCKEWLLFSNFRSWMKDQDWSCKQLDKDIKFKGNKIYSPHNCLFVPQALNSLLTDRLARRGPYPIGVSFHVNHDKFDAKISLNGKTKYLGLFDTPEKASDAYSVARKDKINNIILTNLYPVATQYLAQHI